MLSEELVLALLQAGVTGAGLVLAVYALILPLSKRLFESSITKEVNYLKNLLRNFIENETKDRTGDETFDISSTMGAFLIDELEPKLYDFLKIPSYLRYGVGGTFTGYVLATLFGVAWFADFGKPAMDIILIPTFTISTITFLIIGIISIKDIHRIMREDFNGTIEIIKASDGKAGKGKK